MMRAKGSPLVGDTLTETDNGDPEQLLECLKAHGARSDDGREAFYAAGVRVRRREFGDEPFDPRYWLAFPYSDHERLTALGPLSW